MLPPFEFAHFCAASRVVFLVATSKLTMEMVEAIIHQSVSAATEPMPAFGHHPLLCCLSATYDAKIKRQNS